MEERERATRIRKFQSTLSFQRPRSMPNKLQTNVKINSIKQSVTELFDFNEKFCEICSSLNK